MADAQSAPVAASMPAPWVTKGYRGWILTNRAEGITCYVGRGRDAQRAGVRACFWPVPFDSAGAFAMLDAVSDRDTLALRSMMADRRHDLGLAEFVGRWEQGETTEPTETPAMPNAATPTHQAAPLADDLARKLESVAVAPIAPETARLPIPTVADPMLQFLMLKMQADEAARARSADMMMKLAAVVLPALLPALVQRPAPASGLEDQLKSILSINQAQTQAAMQMMAETFAGAQKIKDTITEQMLARAMERDERGGGSGTGGGIAGVIREVRLGLAMVASDAQRTAPALAPQPSNLPETISADEFDVAGVGGEDDDQDLEDETPIEEDDAEKTAPLPAPVPAPAAPKPTAAGLVLSALRKLWEANEPAADTSALDAQLAGVIATDRALKAAVVSGDEVQLFSVCAPIVSATPGMLDWLAMEGVEEWLTGYVGERLRPLLLPRMRVVDDPTAAKPSAVASAAAEPARKVL